MHHLSICSECGCGHNSDTCVSDGEVVAWFDSQSEEFLRDMSERFDANTPREVWNAFFCSSPAIETAPASSPASADAGQGMGTSSISVDQILAYAKRTLLSITPDMAAAEFDWRLQSVFGLELLLLGFGFLDESKEIRSLADAVREDCICLGNYGSYE